MPKSKEKKPDFIIIPHDADADLIFDNTTVNDGYMFFREAAEAGASKSILRLITPHNPDFLKDIPELYDALRPLSLHFPYYAIRRLPDEAILELLRAHNFVAEMAKPHPNSK